MSAKLLQLCPTLCNPMDSSPQAPLSKGILQARVGCHALLHGIFPTQGLKLHLFCLLHKRHVYIWRLKIRPGGRDLLNAAWNQQLFFDSVSCYLTSCFIHTDYEPECKFIYKATKQFPNRCCYTSLLKGQYRKFLLNQSVIINCIYLTEWLQEVKYDLSKKNTTPLTTPLKKSNVRNVLHVFS